MGREREGMSYAEFRNLFYKIKRHMKWCEDKTWLWFMVDNPHFGGCAPMQLISMGRIHKVAKFVDAAIEESKPPKRPKAGKRGTR